MMSRRAVRYHEAGHAVAALMSGGRVWRIQVLRKHGIMMAGFGVPTEGWGMTDMSGTDYREAWKDMNAYPDSAPLHWREAVNAAFSSGAGAAAEAKATGRPLRDVQTEADTSADLEQAELALWPFFPKEQDREARRTCVFEIWDKGAPLVTEGAAWATIRKLAGALRWKKDLEEEMIARIVKRAGGLPSAAEKTPIVDVKMPPLEFLKPPKDS